MRIVLLCKSDTTGGAAVVTRRLTEALRQQGADARMLVVEKLSGLPYVEEAGFPVRKRLDFLAERMQIFLADGFSRRNLFKVDTASFGLPLWKHPAVKEADAVILNWINQGMLSLDGVGRICDMGKKVIWTMHDMWNATGICHYSLGCMNFTKRCGDCFFLGSSAGKHDLSRRIFRRKKELYSRCDIKFVGVSGWVAQQARISALLGERDIEVIPNPLCIEGETDSDTDRESGAPRRILFTAASLDNWIKGLDTFREAGRHLTARRGKDDLEIALLGSIKNPGALEGFHLPVRYLGTADNDETLRRHYRQADVVVNCSEFECFGATLAEGQAFGAVPVSFDRGGQKDIIDHLSTGYLAQWNDSPDIRAANIAEGIDWALENRDSIKEEMRRSALAKFSYSSVARRYLSLIGSQS